MEKEITYRQLAAVAGVDIHTIRRYGKVVLGADPVAGAQSGLVRTFTETEAFILLLTKRLVDDFGFSLAEAGQHALRIVSEVDKRGFWPAGARDNDIFEFDALIQPGHGYALRLFAVRKRKKIDWDEQSITVEAKYTDYEFPKGKSLETTGPVYTVPLSELLQSFIRWVDML
jgi:hypothetical protein